MTRRPAVLFICVHNAGRSQMAAAFLEHHGRGLIDVRSAGTEPASAVNPVVAEAMNEVGIDLGGRVPRRLDPPEVAGVDVAITMGCGDACPVYPGVRYEDWDVGDPAGRSLEEVRPIRDEIERRVIALAARAIRGVTGTVRSSHPRSNPARESTSRPS